MVERDDAIRFGKGVDPAPWPVVMLAGGFDPSGGAGITADWEVVLSAGCHPCGAISAIAIQSPHRVSRVVMTEGEAFMQQLEHASRLGPGSLKVGMLGNREMVEVLSGWLEENPRVPVVLDPVLASSAGQALLDQGGRQVLQDTLFGRVALLTPNVLEAEYFTGLSIDGLEKAIQAAHRLQEMGAGAVLLKGGHLPGEPADVLCVDGRVRVFPKRRLAADLHGTGCRLAAAVAAGLALGLQLEQAVEEAIAFLQRLLDGAEIWGRIAEPRSRSCFFPPKG